MRSKNFKTSFESVMLGENNKLNNNKHKLNNIPKEVRATFIVNESILEKLKAISFWDRKLIKTTIDEALSNYIEQYENKNGTIQLPK